LSNSATFWDLVFDPFFPFAHDLWQQSAGSPPYLQLSLERPVQHSRQQRIQLGAGLCLEMPECVHFCLKFIEVGDDAAAIPVLTPSEFF
jgi:hypothetical protein